MGDNKKVFGKIIILGGAIPEKHELETANILAAMGKDIEFLPPSYAKGIFSPDLLMDGQRWEMKSPCGCSKRTIENNFRRAQKQSENIIFDLRRIGLDENVAISKIKRELSLQRSGKIRRIIIITKNNKILDFKR
jgi:hypothetical protein